MFSQRDERKLQEYACLTAEITRPRKRVSSGGTRSALVVFVALTVLGSVAKAESPATKAGVGLPLARLKCASSYVHFNAHGTLILTAGQREDGHSEARVWDAKTFAPLMAPVNCDGLVMLAKFAAEGKTIIMATSKVVRLWDWQTGKTLLEVARPEGYWPYAAVSSDGSRIALAIQQLQPQDPRNPCEIRILDAGTGRLIQALHHPPRFEYMTFSADGSRLVAVEWADLHQRTFRVWNLPVGTLAFDPIITGYDAHADGHEFVPTALSPDGRFLAVAGQLYFGVYNAATGEKLFDSEPKGPKDPDESYLNFVEFSSKGDRILSIGHGGPKLWDAATGRLLNPPVPDMAIFAHSLSPDGQRLFCSYAIYAHGQEIENGDGMWDFATGKRLPTFNRGYSLPTFSPNGRRAATVKGLHETQIWDVEEERPKAR